MFTPEAQAMFNTKIALIVEKGQRDALIVYSTYMLAAEKARKINQFDVAESYVRLANIVRDLARENPLYVDPTIAFS